MKFLLQTFSAGYNHNTSYEVVVITTQMNPILAPERYIVTGNSYDEILFNLPKKKITENMAYNLILHILNQRPDNYISFSCREFGPISMEEAINFLIKEEDLMISIEELHCSNGVNYFRTI